MKVAFAFLLVLCTLISHSSGDGKGMVFDVKSSIYVNDGVMFTRDLMLNRPSSSSNPHWPGYAARRDLHNYYLD